MKLLPTAEAEDEGIPLSDWPAMVRRRLARSTPHPGGTVSCGDCPKTFANGWSWLNHFERSYGRLVCGQNYLLAVWGYRLRNDGLWEKTP